MFPPHRIGLRIFLFCSTTPLINIPPTVKSFCPRDDECSANSVKCQNWPISSRQRVLHTNRATYLN